MGNTYSNRGKSFENAIETINQLYLNQNKALVQKVPTPTTIKADNHGNIKYAFYNKKSTVDFIGIINQENENNTATEDNIESLGIFIAFDCKETRGGTLHKSKVPIHQLRYLWNVQKRGGIAFLNINFLIQNKNYLIFVNDDFLSYYNNNKSISLAYCREHGYEVENYDYLTTIYRFINRNRKEK